MITFTSQGGFNKTEKFLRQMSKHDQFRILKKYGQQGVAALFAATPKQTGTTANAWSYEITKKGSSYSISWLNSNVVDGVSIAVILQYGHASRNGGYVKGVDYINPVIKPIFDQIAKEAWEEVLRA